jgi:formiminoglutamase
MNDVTCSEMAEWRGRVDTVDGDAGRRWHQVVRPAPTSPDAARGLALLGFASDAGVQRNHGRVGAAAGPRTLRRFLSNFAWHGTASDALYDAGDVPCRDDGLEAAQSAYATCLAELLRAGHRVIGLGGGREIAWGSYQGIALACAGQSKLQRLGIVNFDAHFDLRRQEQPGRGSSGTPFLQIAEARAAAGLDFRYLCLGINETANTPALFAQAARLSVEFVTDVDVAAPHTDAKLQDFVASCDGIYLTFCLDVLPPAVAPGVSAPSGLGVPLHRAMALLRQLRRDCANAPGGDKLALADIAEFSPSHDAPDARTARTAARIVYEMAALGR